MADAKTSRLSIALEPKVVRRAVAYALVVGAILITINHGDALLSWATASEPVPAGRLWRMGLTTLVPYVVSTFSSVGAIRDMRLKAAGPA